MSFITKKHIKRRTFLQGAGVTLATLPLKRPPPPNPPPPPPPPAAPMGGGPCVGPSPPRTAGGSVVKVRTKSISVFFGKFLVLGR